LDWLSLLAACAAWSLLAELVDQGRMSLLD
jgi:hypothetical protein